MQVDDPPYLSVGTAVSAKYKGAFCEAKVSKVVRMVKCKVTYKMGLGTATLNDDQIKGTLRVGQVVQAKHPDKKELVEATISKIQDCSQYTVVFDDGDITTLRRTALCLKSGRHFNESETLDQLPLTHPEHFSNPVVGGRRGRRSRQPKEDSSDGEVEEENEPDLEGYLSDIGRVVSVETSDKKRNKDNWFPGLVVIPSAQPTVRINAKDEYLIRSFKDGRYYTVPKKEVTEFSREVSETVESPSLSEAIQKVLKFLDYNELPPHWEKSTLFHQSLESESDENFSESSDDEPCEEKDHFVAQLYKFMDDAGTPLNKTPTIATRDIDLHRLFRVVEKLGGYNRVTNKNKWRNVTAKLHLPMNQNTFNQVKSVYKKWLSSYETFYRTLGVTMLNHTRPNKKNRGRSLIRDRDRSTPIHSPAAVEKEEEEEKKEEVKVKPKEKKKVPQTVVAEVVEPEPVDPLEIKETVKESPKESGRPKRERTESKTSKDKKVKEGKVKALVEKFEEQAKKEEEEKVQFTRSKSQSKLKEAKEAPPPPPPPPPVVVEKKPEPKPREQKPVAVKVIKKSVTPVIPQVEEEPPAATVVAAPIAAVVKKKGKKRVAEEKNAEVKNEPIVNIGDKLKVYYGPTHESKVTYEAKVIEIDKDQSGPVYLVHYTGWNTRYDEWIQPPRIAENLTSSTRAKRQKQTPKTALAKTATTTAKRKRGSSVTSRSTASEPPPRSTTPSSVTSSSSRTKSPAVTSTRSQQHRITRRDASKRIRRVSAQTDVSVPTESDSEGTESEPDLSRTRSGAKPEEPELRTYRRKINRPSITPKQEKRKEKEDEDTEKEEEPEKPQKRTRRSFKRSPERSAEESEDETNPPKGRDFDLNQIRSELKGFTKAIKVPAVDPLEKDAVSSSDESTNPPPLEKPTNVEDTPAEEPEKEEEEEEEEEKSVPEKSPQSSEDIYEFKEPEPFEFESRSKLTDEKNIKKRLVPRLFEDLDKSPKKKSPKQDSPDRRSFRRLPLRRQDSSDEDEPVRSATPTKEVDPFDKLVESPSFNIIKTVDKPIEKPQNVVRNLSEDSLSLFRDVPETEDDYSKDMELSDCESQTQIFTRETELFSDAFSKASPDQNTMDMEFSSGKTDEGKLKDSDDDLREQIQRAIAQSSSTDDDSNDALLITPPTNSYQAKKKDIDVLPNITNILTMATSTQSVETPKEEEEPPAKVDVKKEEPIPEKPSSSTEKQIISPALQETDSSLLESIVSQPPISLDIKLEETAKELGNVKTGTKIADSILQKFSSIKKSEAKIENEEKIEPVEPTITKVEEEKKPDFKFELPKEEIKHITAESELPEEDVKVEESLPEQPEQKEEELKPEAKPEEKTSPIAKVETTVDLKKRKKVLSRAFIEESDSDSSDSEQLVIARSDDDSQTNSLDAKIQMDPKESDSSNLFTHLQTTTDDSQSQEERNFNFDVKEDEEKENEQPAMPVKEDEEEEEEEEEEVEEEEEEEVEAKTETLKEEEPDPQLHSLLLCEEEIPRSPAPPSEAAPVPENKPKSEMPFASAPGTSSNSKSMLLEQPQPKKLINSPPVPLERENRVDTSTVLDNTPPTTPDSSISNLSPRGENGELELSPNPGDESCKSNDVDNDYPRRRNSSVKVSPYSEEDTQMIGDPNKKAGQENISPPFKKRRKSLRSNEDSMPLSKRTKKSLDGSRHNSDSDDTSEHSNGGNSMKISSYDRGDRSPRPSKYNFFVEFDPSLDSSQRIAVLQQKLAELRKTYADVKAELAAVERRRKKIRRREREALKAAKQEMACA